MRFRSEPGGRSCRIWSLAAIVAGSLLASQTRAALRMGPDVPRAAFWQQLYDRLPDNWKTGSPIVVREVTDKEMDRLVAESAHQASNDPDSIVDGYYQGGAVDGLAPTITLRRSLHGESAALVFLHEYSHYIWEARLSDLDRKDYRRIWAKQRRARRLVTDYAADSAEEGFAEACAYYLRKPEVLRRKDADSWRFVDSLIPEVPAEEEEPPRE